MKPRHDYCPRDGHGFCAIAQRGHKLCPMGSDRCRIDSHAKADKAWDEIVDRYIAEGRAARAAKEGAA
ncbi:MAG: hypothetical protein ACK4Q4_00650 [Rhodocyclaceae bacterium]|jgi:hypothetical protein